MKKSSILFLLLALLSFSCQEDEKPIQSSLLSQEEIETLLFTREEEKLAHDVYIYAFQKYGLQVFQNIANSETSHVSAVLQQMNLFQLADPLKGSTVMGEFTDPVINQLYQDLTSKVDISLGEAIKVGLTIEDLDILDLQNAISETSQSSLIQVYSSLKCGSENHMRSFYNQALNNNITYIPQYISPSYFNQIISSSITSCNSN
ncbi:hypothetical protein DFQ04_3154 [Algoriphagus boseongensis]|uniref:DUF2202 domain-containing protein n=1 Tax=Algoriphagus boseongensis TaxID=1442587 RepID=A0A4R6T6D6_9BACT|nr:DUF2202 domain-containing protein [Algoriphagus boseongensis]TDQ15267.1 hypothetical protein DFQ04_3154 [Algoriphagus boseongensis]